MLAALVAIGLAIPFSCQYGWSCFAGYGHVPGFGEVHQALFPLIDKTRLGAFRILHFLAIAYVAYTIAGEGGRRLSGVFVERAQQVGRQTLAVFLSGLVLAQALGVLLDAAGRTVAALAVANLGGCAMLVLVAAAAEWFKSSPWARAVRAESVPGSPSLANPASLSLPARMPTVRLPIRRAEHA